MPISRLLIALTLILLALPATALADGFAPAVDLSDPANGANGYAQVAFDPAGNATAAWTDNHGNFDVIATRRIGADGTVGPARDLSADGTNASFPVVATDGAGNATVAWSRDGVVQARRIAADGTLGPVRDLSNATYPSTDQQVAVTPSGDAIVVWTIFSGNVVVQARRIAADGTLGATQDVSTGTNPAERPDVVLDAGNNATVAYRQLKTTNRIAKARRIAADGTLGPVQDLSADGGPIVAPKLGLDGTTVVATWDRENAANFHVIQTRRLAANGTLTNVQDLSDPTVGSEEPDLDVDPSGNAFIAWDQSDGTVKGRFVAANGSVSALRDVASGNAASASVAMDQSGNATIAWDRFDGVNNLPETRTVAAGGALGQTQTLSNDDVANVDAAVDGQGHALVAWTDNSRTNATVQERQFFVSPSCNGTSATASGSTAVTLPCTGKQPQRQIVSGPAHGSLGSVDDAAGTVTYTPAAGYSGADSFTYKAVNGGGESATVTAQISVAAAATDGSGSQGAGNGAGVGTAGGAARVALLGSRLAFRGKTATESARCDAPAGDQCTLTLSLATGAKAARKKKRAKATTLATASATVPGGQTATVTWKLTAAGAKALRHKRSLAVALTGTSRNRGGETTSLSGRRTITRAKAKRRKR